MLQKSFCQIFFALQGKFGLTAVPAYKGYGVIIGGKTSAGNPYDISSYIVQILPLKFALSIFQ